MGTLFSAMVARIRFAELMLPVLLLPFMVPPLIFAVKVTVPLLAGHPLSEAVAGLSCWHSTMSPFSPCHCFSSPRW